MPTYDKEHFEKEQEKLKEKQRKVKEKHDAKREKAKRAMSVQSLDPQVRTFCLKVAEGNSPSDAALMAGYEDPGMVSKRLMRRPVVKRVLNQMINRTIAVSETTREDVIEGFKDAIAIARQQSEAAPMVAGWREIGKMLGMYETKVKVEVTGGGSEIERQLKTMSDADLLAMVHERSALLNEAIDAEYTEMDEEDEDDGEED